MSCKPEIGLKFLRWLYPQGPWALTAIDQEKIEPTKTQTFRPESETVLIEWLQRWNVERRWNIYYHVNKPTHDLVKKAEREDIAEMGFLHVDIDPRIGEKLEDEHTRIRKLLDENLPPGVPKPSGIVFSGGGYNALWRLTNPIPIYNESLTKAEIEARYEEAKRWNLQLEIVFGGDNCHNIDRILRLPGTTNWPDPKKRLKGRVPVFADIHYLSDDSYSIDRFIAATPIQRSGTSLHHGIKVAVSGNIQRLAHVNELGDKVSNKAKMIIVQGQDPDDPNRFGTSRSEWLFFVCCEMVRAGIKDDVIYSVITDPSFGISASVLDKGSSTQRYALRQIQRAKEHAIDPKLCMMNERYWVIGNTGGKCRVLEEVEDHALNRKQLTMQTFEDFRNRHMNEKVVVGSNKKGEDITVPLGEWWLRHPNRRQYDHLVFVPGREIPNAYNMWTGFSVEAKPGNRHELFLQHLRDHICGGVQHHYEYLIRWFARAVQHPDTQGEVAVVLRGEPGVGKGAVVREFGKLWGRHFLQISNPKHLVGNFNIHLKDSVIVFADEAFYAGDKQHEAILKGLVTEDLLALEGKFINVESGRNYVHLILASNKKWVIPAEVNERRYFVLDVKSDKMNDHTYWSEFYSVMDHGGRENLLHFLLTFDLKGYNVRNVPQTEGLREQKLLSLTTEQEWWFQKLESGLFFPGHEGWEKPVLKDKLFDDYIQYAQKIGQTRRSTGTALGRFLHTVTPGGLRSRQISVRNEDGSKRYDRPYAYYFPPLQECRHHWDEKFSGPYHWVDYKESFSDEPEAFGKEG